jgi:hypothetical protein
MIEHLFLFATLVLGLFAGSLLTEAMILVPYWRRMESAEFFRLHGSLGPSLFRYFAPLTTLAVVLAVVVALIEGPRNVPWLISAALCLTTLVIFFVYFRAANNRFANHDVAAEKLSGELQNWANWHWVRTILAIVALGFSIYGHSLVIAT